ncbi:nucleoside-diphosphate kinase [bacterium]|nr:nucleoside-diphosphate kinase [bacterium]
MEQSLILVKPDGVERGLVGEVISRIEKKGLRLAALKMVRIDEALARVHYRDHVAKPFFPDLLSFITRSPVVAMVVEGNDCVELMRALIGATKHTEAAPGTIRGDYAYSFTENLVHGSDSPESARREIGIFFSPDEIFSQG